MKYPREKLESLVSLTSSHSVALLYGPRAAGQSTLLRELTKKFSCLYINLSKKEQLDGLKDPADYLTKKDKLIIIDHIQSHPDPFTYLKKIHHLKKENLGKLKGFIVAGIHTKEGLDQSLKAFKGEAAAMELAGLNPLEIEHRYHEPLRRIRVRGGFPASYSAKTDQSAAAWRKKYIDSYLGQDLMGPYEKIPVEMLQRFWIMMAHSQGKPWRPDVIGDSLGEDEEVAEFLLQHLENHFLIRKLPPWSGKPTTRRKRIKTPKTYVRDSGVMNTLLGIVDYEDLISHLYFGRSWEGSVVEHILASLPAMVKASYFRTHAGAELELVLEFGSEVWALCFTSSSIPKIYEDFPQSCEDVQATRRFSIYTGDETYPRKNHNTVIPLADFMMTLREHTHALTMAA